jgi:hypothetical protein
MSYVTSAEIASLEHALAQYHATHEDQYGPMETCSEIKCVETKLGLEWLKQRLKEREATGASDTRLS